MDRTSASRKRRAIEDDGTQVDSPDDGGEVTASWWDDMDLEDMDDAADLDDQELEIARLSTTISKVAGIALSRGGACTIVVQAAAQMP